MSSFVTSSVPGPAATAWARPASVQLRLHAYPALQVDGHAAPLKLKHALALLAHLSLAGGPVGRAHLAGLLWPEGDAALVRGRLRRLVHQAHEAVETVLFEGDADSLWLRPGWQSDVQETLAAVARLGSPNPAPEDLARLVEPLLAPQAAGWLEGFSLGSEPFDNWVDQVRRGHAAALARALERAAGLVLGTPGEGQPAPSTPSLAESAVDLADRIADALLRLDPCHEGGHGTRMAARAARGDAAGVETAYFDCARMLREELGVRPSAALEAAYARAAAAVRPAVPGMQAPGRAAAAGTPEIRLARTPLGHVAYADWGTAGHDGARPTLVVQWGIMSNLEVALDEPRARALLDRLAQRYRIVMLDRRGSGLAERVGVSPDAAAGVEDIVATLDDLGVGRAWLFGSSVGGTLALEFALRQPERTAGLLLYGTSPVGRWREDWPWALPASRLDDWIAGFTDPARYDESLRRMAPGVADDPAVQRWYARLLRNSSTPHGAAVLLRAYQAMDLRPRLAQVDVPTLVMQRRGDRIVPLAAGERLARSIPGARFQLLEGEDHFLWYGETATLMTALQRFVDRHAEGAAAQRLAA